MAQTGGLSSEIESLSHVFGLVEAFRAFDGDNDGCITAAELGGILGSLGYNASEQDVRAMVQQGDKNKDGLLSLSEFLELNTKNLELGGVADLLKTAVEDLDADGDEVLTGEELYEMMGNLGVEMSIGDCQNVVASLDMDGDGAVSLEDLKLILNSLL
ncbi:putative Calmodulin [Quillaja saponaria]|uniref:Calmodulin n=1 Tax=Quillaja saponaria TaxID=32244 RepID=A0AAD7LJ35_QUISA|nr:putative Calmodulin [Quillaja saponaria]